MARARASVIVLRDDRVALMERWRDGHHYFVAPGGGVEPGETLEQAAVREAHEELGIEIVISGTVGDFFVATTNSDFGPMTGPERETPTNRYRRVWVDLADVAPLGVQTPGLKEALASLDGAGRR